MRITMKHRCELMQLRVAKAFGLDRLHRRGHVIAIGAGLAVALDDMAVLLGERQPAGILHMAAVDDVSECGDTLARIILQPHRAHHLAIDRRDLLARAQIGDDVGTVLLGDAEGDAAAGAAAAGAAGPALVGAAMDASSSFISAPNRSATWFLPSGVP